MAPAASWRSQTDGSGLGAMWERHALGAKVVMSSRNLEVEDRVPSPGAVIQE